MTAQDFRNHSASMRKMGAVRVSVADGDVSYECEWPGPPEEKAPAIGFMSSAESDGYDYEETD